MYWYARQVTSVLFWFSKRNPDYKTSYVDLTSMFGEFPQLVNAKMIKKVKEHCDYYVQCVSKRGVPQPLISRFTGKPVTIDLSKDREDFKGIWHNNPYYPSPQMHEDAVLTLEEVCRSLAKC